MESVNIYEAKNRLSELVDHAAAGHEVVVCRHGRPVARLTALAEARPKVRFGVLKRKVRISEDFDAPLPPDVLEGFER